MYIHINTNIQNFECVWEIEGPEKWKIDLEMLDSLRPSDIFSSVSFLLLSLEKQQILTEKSVRKMYRFLLYISEIFDFIINSAVDMGNLRQACSVSLPSAWNFASALNRVSPLFLQWKLAEKQGARKKESTMEAVMRDMYELV